MIFFTQVRHFWPHAIHSCSANTNKFMFVLAYPQVLLHTICFHSTKINEFIFVLAYPQISPFPDYGSHTPSNSCIFFHR